jgi:hypothetical protein
VFVAKENRSLILFVGVAITIFFIFGFASDGLEKSFTGFLRLQISPARLLTDFTAVESPGAALVNAGFVGLLALFFLRINGIALSGGTMTAVFTMMGFALFGKTILNSVPILAGVCLSALIVGKSPKEYVLIAMFGTAMGPLVTFVAFELGLPAILALPFSLLIGLVIGIVLPPIAIAMLHLHQGYNLYNIGLTAGFLGLFSASISGAAGADIVPLEVWNTAFSPWIASVVPVVAFVAIGIALVQGNAVVGRPARDARAARGTRQPTHVWREFLAIQKYPGRLPSDFADLVSVRGALLNVGIVGLLFWIYVMVVGGPFNGPVLGALMTILGFAAFGKHVRNVVPVVAGVFLATLFFGKGLTEPGPLLAFLFVTALAPIAGEFGAIIGIVGGFLHFVMVLRTGDWHGGMDLYNNGFASGLTATLIVSIIEWYRSNKPAR